MYKTALPHAEAVAHIVDKRGIKFDPNIVETSVSNHEWLRPISERQAEGTRRWRENGRHQFQRMPALPSHAYP